MSISHERLTKLLRENDSKIAPSMQCDYVKGKGFVCTLTLNDVIPNCSFKGFGRMTRPMAEESAIEVALSRIYSRETLTNDDGKSFSMAEVKKPERYPSDEQFDKAIELGIDPIYSSGMSSFYEG